MRVGVLGTGMVGKTIATKLRELDHDVQIGSRSTGDDAVPFAEAAGHGQLVFNCTAGTASLEALAAAGEENLAGKILVDVANPLDFSKGMPPTLSVCNDDSLGEQIQRTYPDAKIVKALNTVNASVMVDPGSVPGEHDLFICGDDDEAKAHVTSAILEPFGWPAGRIHDLGDITGARTTEMYLPLWVRLMGVVGGATFNIRVVH
jgi:8-hydroxy-5-deazaflavin:NADPH oxidoreductase